VHSFEEKGRKKFLRRKSLLWKKGLFITQLPGTFILSIRFSFCFVCLKEESLLLDDMIS
jgi:hypothetical protein